VDWYVGVAEAFGHGPDVVGRPNGLSEDCLYLNVWSPQTGKDSGLPVMVFVHGGSNSGGWSYEPNYLGENLAARGVVVVTVAYRLGPFGFFSHPALDNGGGEPLANFALLDIRMAFQWVAEHIDAFGGDPENITGFGESAGAFDLVDLLLADLAAGGAPKSMFRRLISQSIGGPAMARKTLAEEQAAGVFLAEQAGLESPVSADSLRRLPAETVLQAAEKLPPDHYHSAVIDGLTIPMHPLDVLKNIRAGGVEVIAGTNADEWYMYVGEDLTQQDVRQWIEENAPGNREALLEAVAGETDPRRALDRLRTAQSMLCPSRYLARRLNESGGRAWVYYFTRQRAGSGGERLKAYHGAELPYVFDSHDAWLPVEAIDRELTRAVMDYWVQFAKTGNPNLAGRPEWPVHSRQDPAVMELGTRVGGIDASSTALCELLGPGSRQLENVE
jgi:para-nitrobenzyl esterase